MIKCCGCIIGDWCPGGGKNPSDVSSGTNSDYLWTIFKVKYGRFLQSWKKIYISQDCPFLLWKASILMSSKLCLEEIGLSLIVPFLPRRKGCENILIEAFFNFTQNYFLTKSWRKHFFTVSLNNLLASLSVGKVGQSVSERMIVSDFGVSYRIYRAYELVICVTISSTFPGQ